MDIHLPVQVQEIIEKLNSHSFEAYVVGGCVRDSIIGKVPEDWDITTDALPGEIKSLFSKTADTGIKHGTVTVVLNGMNFEVTTFRIDGRYSDNRRPEKVEFTSSLTDDLSRRDFTVNAIAFHPKHGCIDPFSGVRDIKRGIIQTVGNPDERFGEDALRMLRAIRFSAQLGFAVDSGTLQAVGRNSSLIDNISRERIRDELSKILISAFPGKFELLMRTGLLTYILPEFEAHSTVQCSFEPLALVENNPILRWAMLLSLLCQPLPEPIDELSANLSRDEREMLAGGILKRLRFDNGSIVRILKLVRYHDMVPGPDVKAVRKMASQTGGDIFEELLKVREAHIRAQNHVHPDEKLEKLNAVKEIYKGIKRGQECLVINDLAVNGDDLLELGFVPGRHIGAVLRHLLEEVLEDPRRNNREFLLDTALKYLKQAPG